MEKNARLISIVIVVLLLPGAAMAVNLLSIRDLPVQYMTDEDKEILRAAADDALERSRDGETAHWENPKTGAHGELNPRMSFERDGRPCRELEVANSAQGRDNRLVVTLCKQSDGGWKIESR